MPTFVRKYAWFFLLLPFFFSVGVLAQKNVEDSVILLKNEQELLPIQSLDKIKIGLVTMKSDFENNQLFYKMLKNYTEIASVVCDDTNSNWIEELREQIATFDIVISSYYQDSKRGQNLAYILNALSKKLIMVNYNSEDFIGGMNKMHNLNSLIYVDGDQSLDQISNVAQLIFGGLGIQSKLKRDLGNYSAGYGLEFEGGIRIRYSSLENEGYQEEQIHNMVSEIMTQGIKEKAFPGAQLLVVKNKAVIYHETFGHHTYNKQKTVMKDDIYDLASVTKITGALPVLMKFVDQGKMELDTPFSTYWRSWRGKTDKKDLTLREILAHQAGLNPYIVFAAQVIKKGEIKRRWIRKDSSKTFGLSVYKDMYLRNSFRKKIYRTIRKTKVSEDKKYKYSGVSFLIYPELTYQLSGDRYEEYLQNEFYKPLGAHSLGFNAYTYYPFDQIIPTEYDGFFRKDSIQGYVHDENAALMGGISANAGLFGTANDLAKLMQMYLNFGVYGGQRFISEQTLKEFTRIQYPENGNKRGLGFDKPLINNSKKNLQQASPAPEAGEDSFGHGGFTGTYIWADPSHDLVFIFLSNRVHPDRTHRKLYSLNIRPTLMQLFLNAQTK